MKNSIFNTASAVAPVSEILSTRKGLIAMSIQNDNRKMTVFNRLEEIAMQVKKMIKPAVATIAIGVALAGVMNTVEVKAQAVEVRGKIIHIAPNENPNTTQSGSNVHRLVFNKGGNGTENNGYWGLGTLWNGFHIGIQHPTPNATGIGIFINNANKDVCIGGWDPQSKLDVRGWIRMNGQTISSDHRYKKDIKPINTNIDKLSKLNSVEYRASTSVLEQKKSEFIKQFDTKDTEDNFVYHQLLETIESQIRDVRKDTVAHFGFIAQELRELYPNLVFEDTEGFLSVNYVGLIPVLVDAIKELKTEINEQQKQINELRGGGFEKTNATVISNAKLYQNNPNPFSENTEIQYYVPENANEAMICIYDLTGSQIVRFDLRDRGVISSLTVRGNQLKAGMYIYSLIVDGREIDTKRMILTDK
ncbi:MAG: tail fiber domain-containing protein [Firmicutes bacterium]|nr:tail fiber domain-containing protein [Bacillota bacterium]